jgi:teichoic acid transport system ATP-binding protein
VEFSGLGEFIDMPMRTYSSGMGARLRFAIAAAKTHDVLLVDEALATGDKEFRKKSEQRIRELRDAAGTVFLVSHSMKSITDTCDRTIWVDNGKLRMDGPTKEVVKAYLADA